MKGESKISEKSRKIRKRFVFLFHFRGISVTHPFECDSFLNFPLKHHSVLCSQCEVQFRFAIKPNICTAKNKIKALRDPYPKKL